MFRKIYIPVVVGILTVLMGCTKCPTCPTCPACPTCTTCPACTACPACKPCPQALCLPEDCYKYSGYGRYTMYVDCDSVELCTGIYKVTQQGGDLYIAGHKITRGIYRESIPWLYVHQIECNKVDITFDDGSDSTRPINSEATLLSAGDLFSISSPEVTPSTIVGPYDLKFWLVANRWMDNDVCFDLQQQLEDTTHWNLVKGDICVPENGRVIIKEINATVHIKGFDAAARKAWVYGTTPEEGNP